MNPALKNFFRPINLVYWTVLFGMVAMLGASYMISTHIVLPDTYSLDWLIYAAPLSGMAFIILGERTYRRQIMKAKANTELSQQLQGFRSAIIARMMILDAATIVLILSFAFTSNILFAGLALIIIFMYLLGRPTAEKMVRDLQIEGLEKDVILGNEPMETKGPKIEKEESKPSK